MENHALLVEAGYRYSPEFRTWVHPTCKRALDAGLAGSMATDQLQVWIARGVDQRDW